MADFYHLPVPFFDEIKEYATQKNLTEVLGIVAKHRDGDIELERWEADLLHKVGQIWSLEAELKYPFWNPDNSYYNEEHDELLGDERDEHFGKILMTFPPLD